MSTDTQLSPEHLKPDLTEVGEFDKETEGYFVMLPLPEHVKEYIGTIQDRLADQIPSSDLWLPQGDQLHITFAHVVSPDTDYDAPRAELYEQLREDAERATENASEKVKGKTIIFNEIAAFPGAIILKGVDDGSIDEARAQFADELHTPEGTRTPPKIIHTTIARFRSPIPMEQVREAVGDIHPDVEFQVPGLQLIRELEMYTQSHTVLKEA